MTFAEAAAFIMPFGKYAGCTLDGIALDDKGLKYLDWLRGERAQEGKNSDVDKALAAYLDDPTIQRELNK